MANGVKNLRKIQIGGETTAGTAVAADVIWRGQGALKDEREIVFPVETVGYLQGTDRSYISKTHGSIAMEATPATFTQLPHIMEASICVAVPVRNGTGSGYRFPYTGATTSIPTLKTYTIEGGDNNLAEEMEYSYVTDWELSGKGGEAVMVAANWAGRQVTSAAFTSLSLAAVEEVIFSKGTVYIDDTTIGSTAVSQTLLEFSLTYNSGIIEKFTPNGQLYFAYTQLVQPEAVLSLTYEHNTSAGQEKDDFRNQNDRFIRLKFLGSALTTVGGGTETTKVLQIDVHGKYETWEALTDQNGNDVVTCTLRARPTDTGTLFCNVNIIAEMATVP